MTWRKLGVGALVLWGITMVAVVVLFVQGQTRPGLDRRTEIVLAPAERDLILEEMRQLLKAVHGVIGAEQPGPKPQAGGRGGQGGGHADVGRRESRRHAEIAVGLQTDGNVHS